MPSKRESIAKREGFKILKDQDLLNGAEARGRQLEAERAANQLNRDEAMALGDEAAVEEHAKNIATLEKRLEVVHARRDALMANIAKDAGSGGDGDAPATT